MEAETEQLSPDQAQVDQQRDPGDTSGHSASDTLNTSGESRDPGLYFPQQTYPWQCFPNMAPSYPYPTGLQAMDGLHPLLRGQPGPNGPSPPATPGIGEVIGGHHYQPPAPQPQYSQPPTPDSASSSSDLFQFPNQRADVQQQPSYHPWESFLPFLKSGDNGLGIHQLLMAKQEREEQARKERESAEEKPILHNGKKARNPRTIFTPDQIQHLEFRFQKTPYLSLPNRAELASILGLTQTQIKVWFQNRRGKSRRQKQFKGGTGDQTPEQGDQSSPGSASVPPQGSPYQPPVTVPVQAAESGHPYQPPVPVHSDESGHPYQPPVPVQSAVGQYVAQDKLALFSTQVQVNVNTSAWQDKEADKKLLQNN